MLDVRYGWVHSNSTYVKITYDQKLLYQYDAFIKRLERLIRLGLERDGSIKLVYHYIAVYRRILKGPFHHPQTPILVNITVNLIHV